MPCASSGGSPFPEVLDLGRVGVELAVAQFLASYPGERRVVAPVARELLILEVLEVEQRVVRALGRADQLVELDLDRLGVAVLRVLDEEHHEEGDDRGRSVDHELPGIAEAEERPGKRPQHHRPARDEEGRRATGPHREPARKIRESEPVHRRCLALFGIHAGPLTVESSSFSDFADSTSSNVRSTTEELAAYAWAAAV